MKIILAADHGGYELKDSVKAVLIEQGHEIVDIGTNSADRVDYPVYGKEAAEYVASGKAERGIVFCGSGTGISIAANKVRGIRCANATDEELVRLSSSHNHTNMLALGGRFVSLEDALRFIDIWLTTPWEERHSHRIAMLDSM